MIWHWLAIMTGIDNESGRVYAFWSGFGSDMGEITIIGGAYAIYRKHKCQEHKCWRLAKHKVEGTPYTACRRHHPGIPDRPARGQIARAHADAQAAIPVIRKPRSRT